jgi:hypothetical protein
VSTVTLQGSKHCYVFLHVDILHNRIWVNWLRGYKEWVPGCRAIAAAAALDAALSAGHTAEEAVAASESAAKALGGAVMFITASATLMVQVRIDFGINK